MRILHKLPAAALPALAIVTLGAQGAAAQSTGFFLDGNIEAGYLADNTGGDTIIATDLTFGYDAASAGGGNWGVEFDATGMAVIGGRNYSSLHGDVYYDTSYGRFSVGMPSSAMTDYFVKPKFANNTFMNLQGNVIFGGIIDFVDLQKDIDIYGARFDSTAGGVDFGIGVYNIEGTTFSNAGMSYEFGNYTVSAGVEYIEGEIGYAASLSADYGKFGGIIAYSHPFIGIAGNDIYDIEVTYTPTEPVELTAGYFVSNNSDGFAYLGATYSFLDNGYIGVSGLDVFNPDDSLYEVKIGWNFNYGG